MLSSLLRKLSHFKHQRFVYTFAIWYCYGCYGLATNIWGPTLMELVTLLDTDQKHLAYGNSLIALTYTLTAAVAGYVYNYLNRQVLLAVFMMLMGASCLIPPLFETYSGFIASCCLFGFGEGAADAAIHAWLLEMWGDDNGPYMQALHFFFGVGLLITPLYCAPFLSSEFDTEFLDKSHDKTNISNRIFNTLNSTFSSNISTFSQKANFTRFEADITVPYFLTGFLVISSGLVLLLLYFIDKYEVKEEFECGKKTPESSHVVPKNKSPVALETKDLFTTKMSTPVAIETKDLFTKSNTFYTFFLVALGSVMFCFFVGLETTNFEYIETFTSLVPLADGGRVDQKSAAYLGSSLSMAYTLARAVGIVLSFKLPAKYFLYFDLVCITGSNLVILGFHGNQSKSILAAAEVAFGFGVATGFPSLYSFMEERIHVTNTICGIFASSCAVLSAINPLFVGALIEDQPYVLTWMTVVSVVVVLVVLVVVDVVSSWRSRKEKKEQQIESCVLVNYDRSFAIGHRSLF